MPYLGPRVNELAALQLGDIDLFRHRINIRYNFDKKRRASTVKSAESETWLPQHPEAEEALPGKPGVQGRGTAAVVMTKDASATAIDDQLRGVDGIPTSTVGRWSASVAHLPPN